MDDELFASIKERLDIELLSAPEDVGIAIGSDLWDELRRRDLLSRQTFGWLGTRLGASLLPTYKNRFAFQHFDLRGDEYQVGQRA